MIALIVRRGIRRSGQVLTCECRYADMKDTRSLRQSSLVGRGGPRGPVGIQEDQSKSKRTSRVQLDI